MKKSILFALLALTLLLSLASCAKDKTEPATDSKGDAESVTISDPADLINKVWEKFGENETFPVMGGDIDGTVDGKAGKINIKNTENTTATLHITKEALAKVEDAAALTHMMNANTFTCAAYKVKSADAASLADELKESIKNTQWMCGFPDKLVIYTVNGEYVLAAFGNAQAIDSLQTHVSEVYGSAAALNVEESLAA